MNPTMTLKAIRDKGPCSGGWKTLLVSLGYAGGEYDPERIVSLGDIAKSNDAADAMWCVCALDWSDITVRRVVIAGAVLPAGRRASGYTKDKRIFEAIEIIERWCAGDDKADLNKARKIAYAADAAAYAAAAYAAAAYAAAAYAAAAYAAVAYAADAAYAAAAYAAVAYAADAAADAVAYAADAAADAVAYAADAAAYAAAYAADAAAYRKAEREQQRQDIIAAFPPVALVDVIVSIA